MTIQLTAYRWVPPFAQGYVKDLRVRWALEEAGLPYEEVLIGLEDRTSESYRRWQPFGQVPAYRDDEVELFESGAILLHIAARSEALAPADDAGRARVAAWVFAALNSVEPHAQALIYLEDSGEPVTDARRAQVEATITSRLAALSVRLEGKPYLEGDRFTAGDLIMTTVLRELVDCGALARHPVLDDHRRRCEARPAFARALAAHLRPFAEHAPPDAVAASNGQPR
jgi:glutathione S-transferase